MAGTRRVYMDHSATTRVHPRVLQEMRPFFDEGFGNPSSLYEQGRHAKAALEGARNSIAKELNASPEEVYFTSCGTESDNLALRGVAMAMRSHGTHIITTAVEHHAVLRTCEQLAAHFGCRVTFLPVDTNCLVDPLDVRNAICEDTVLISVMHANNEVGTIEPIREIGAIARERGVPFHTDAVQAAPSLSLDVDELKVDLLSVSGHKLHAPKGVGALYVRAGTPIMAMQTGGGQERGLRAGTENVPYAVGLAAALGLAKDHGPAEARRQAALRDRLIKGITETIPDCALAGHPGSRLCNNASFVFAGIEGEAIQLRLDAAGIATSSGSACSSGDSEPSHVLTAMGYDPFVARGSLRLSLGIDNDLDDVEYVLSVVPGIVRELRAMSPLYEPGVLDR